MKFKCEPDAEISGTYPDGSGWRVTFNSNGTADVTDEHIGRALEGAAADESNPVQLVKSKG